MSFTKILSAYAVRDSCQRGWRLFSIIAAYFDCSEVLRPYLFKYLETAAYDKRRAYHGTANVCLQNLRKTFKFGGRKNVPSIEEIAAISAGRNSKRQIYRLPGGTERVINTKSTTVVNDVIEEICTMLNVRNAVEMEEFSLYCIVEGGRKLTYCFLTEHFSNNFISSRPLHNASEPRRVHLGRDDRAVEKWTNFLPHLLSLGLVLPPPSGESSLH